MKKRKRTKTLAPRTIIKTINFTLREHASIQIFAQNIMNGMTSGEAIAYATELANKLKQIRQPI